MERTKIIDFGKHAGWSKSGKNRVEAFVKIRTPQSVKEYITFGARVYSRDERSNISCGNIMEQLHEFCPELRDNSKFMELYSLSQKYNGSYTEEIPPSDMNKIEEIMNQD
jgi:hypothetical protein